VRQLLTLLSGTVPWSSPFVCLDYIEFVIIVKKSEGDVLKIPHIPVLPKEVKEAFLEIKDGYIVDCTVGYGGHSELILASNPHIKMLCIDQDEEALAFSKKRLEAYHDRVTFFKGRFSSMIKQLEGYDIRGVLADIGVSSLQLDKMERGFSFESETLDMRMDSDHDLDAYQVVNHYTKEELENIFHLYGEVREYKKLADIIVKERALKPFTSAKELSAFIAKHMYAKKIHPATLAFQAIRIEVNDELGELKELLESIKNLNLSNCLVAIISFHSLEDRIVKQRFKEWSTRCICPPQVMRCLCGNNHNIGKVVTKKPIIPSGEEIASNPRSRSSKLRIFHIQ
jgi:16S rRNA (cytosine1402-N4)-methyltransferase